VTLVNVWELALSQTVINADSITCSLCITRLYGITSQKTTILLCNAPPTDTVLIQWAQFNLYCLVINFNTTICLQAATIIIAGWGLITISSKVIYTFSWFQMLHLLHRLISTDWEEKWLRIQKYVHPVTVTELKETNCMLKNLSYFQRSKKKSFSHFKIISISVHLIFDIAKINV
jgi:hypothetical protein